MPEACAVRWNIRRKGRRWRKEALQRWELTPEKIEMADGKLFYTDEQRLAMLGMLLENLGADAAVRLGDSRVWCDAVESLKSDRRAVRKSTKRMDRRITR